MIATYDIAIIGGGIAGAAAAANLAKDFKVLLLERESQPGYHATGRSAALFSEIYGNTSIRALSRASHEFLFNPPFDFCDAPLVARRGALYIANASQVAALLAFATLPDVAKGAHLVSTDEALRLTPCLRRDYVAAGLYEPNASDIDVHRLLQGYLKAFRTQGGNIICNAEVLALQRDDDKPWKINTTAGDFYATTIINAAGAWVDQIAQMAGATTIDIQPLKRCACIAELSSGLESEHWPLTIDIGEQFYFKPDAGCLLISPADETPSIPSDAWPDDLNIAIAIDRISKATTLKIQRLKASWAGLRSFVADRSPVVGFDPQVSNFFWIAGLGGYGIQTAPAISQLAGSLLRKEPLPTNIRVQGLDLASIMPK